MDIIISVFLTLVGSSALFTFIQFLIARRDKKHDKLDKVLSKIDSVDSKVDAGFAATDGKIELLRTDMNTNDEALRYSLEATKATTARVRILRSSDEILHDNMKHSKEWFDQINDDITYYETYCKGHPEFVNNKATHAIQYINKVYAKALQDNDFL